MIPATNSPPCNDPLDNSLDLQRAVVCHWKRQYSTVESAKYGVMMQKWRTEVKTAWSDLDDLGSLEVEFAQASMYVTPSSFDPMDQY